MTWHAYDLWQKGKQEVLGVACDTFSMEEIISNFYKNKNWINITSTSSCL